MMLEREYGVEVIAKLLKNAEKPVSASELRKLCGIGKERFEFLLTSLTHCKLVKFYANKPAVTNPIVVITPKGAEFLRHYQKILALLDEGG